MNGPSVDQRRYHESSIPGELIALQTYTANSSASCCLEANLLCLSPLNPAKPHRGPQWLTKACRCPTDCHTPRYALPCNVSPLPPSPPRWLQGRLILDSGVHVGRHIAFLRCNGTRRLFCVTTNLWPTGVSTAAVVDTACSDVATASSNLRILLICGLQTGLASG